ncbi:hypothetical protein BDN72DRAFT_965711 [Pluteus cervinus]|uniref:Uncharacterized protein n=1 Tax=Pluteus cervinus TaxID=181527 RepID=A0ACD3A3H6_9AGAR|nr:hypothetical protein BDN72DRAFT_965711 [Pluteus cervinus]
MLTVLVLTLAFFRVQAAPFSEAGPATDPTLAHSVVFGIQPRNAGAEANMRTLYDVVRSCLFTIAACVYRAIHQNIPDPEATMWGKLQVRIKMTFYALIAPEAFIWWAMRQRYGAIMIAKEVNELKYGLNWTQTHGQFAQMGGFARKDNKHVLYPKTLIRLLEEGCIDLDQLKLTKEDIDDKSKGDILSKALVAFQTTWFVFECFARLHQKLSLLELEVVTLAFAVLNIITYALWWYKPLNVLRPIYLHIRAKPTDWSPELVNYVEEDGWQKVMWEHFICLTVARPILRLFWVGKGGGMVARGRAAVGTMVGAIKEDVGKWPWWKTVLKWLVGAPLGAVVAPLVELFGKESIPNEPTHVSTFYGMELDSSRSDVSLMRSLSCVIGMVFGAAHFLSWHSTFPTHTELLLWRISSIVLVVQPVLLLLLNIFGDVLYRLDPLGEFSFIFFTTLSLGVGPIAYILARFCLLVLAFLTLNHLPPRALDSITWTSYIPHL